MGGKRKKAEIHEKERERFSGVKIRNVMETERPKRGITIKIPAGRD